MTEELELLTLAAKAMGLELVFNDRGESGYYSLFRDHLPQWSSWNPLESDGDCARMENMLGIDVTWHFAFIPFVQSKHGDFLLCEFIHNHKDDRGAARRMASLRVAAEIGKAMK